LSLFHAMAALYIFTLSLHDALPIYRLKNRWVADLSGLAMKSFDIAGLLKHIADFDALTKGKRRKDLSFDEKRRLDILEAPIVKSDRKSTRLNSSHVAISYAVFSLKK